MPALCPPAALLTCPSPTPPYCLGFECCRIRSWAGILAAGNQLWPHRVLCTAVLHCDFAPLLLDEDLGMCSF